MRRLPLVLCANFRCVVHWVPHLVAVIGDERANREPHPCQPHYPAPILEGLVESRAQMVVEDDVWQLGETQTPEQRAFVALVKRDVLQQHLFPPKGRFHGTSLYLRARDGSRTTPLHVDATDELVSKKII